MSDAKSDAKKAILARRAKFIAAALAGVACGREPATEPQPCLSPPMIPEPDAEPQPCLSPPPPASSDEIDASAPPLGSAVKDAAPAKDAKDAGPSRPRPPPRVCLSVLPPHADPPPPPPTSPPPHPCLKPPHPCLVPPTDPWSK